MEKYNSCQFLGRINEILNVDKKELSFKKAPKNAMNWLKQNLKNEEQPTNFMFIHNKISYRVYLNTFMDDSIWFIKSTNGDIKQIKVNGKTDYNSINL